MIDDKKRELLQKLYALAERGDRGERAAARHQLDKLLAKYHISEEELNEKTMELRCFSYKGDFERKLLHQVFYKVCGADRDIWQHKAGRGKYTQQAVECTKAEAIQIQIEFDFYRQLLADEMEFFYRAFIQKHEIYGTDPLPAAKNRPPLSRAELFRMSMLMNGMEDRTMRKMIEGGQG